MCVDIIPVVNPYGFDNMQRSNVNQVDLNRDYADFSTITTKAIAEYIKSVKDLKVVLDLHNTMATVSEFIAGQHYKKFPIIKEAYYELSSAILPKMAEIYADNGANYPYIIITTPDDTSGKGQLHWYLNENNIFGHTFEVPRSMEFGLVNNSKTCQITKNALINLMQIYIDL